MTRPPRAVYTADVQPHTERPVRWRPLTHEGTPGKPVECRRGRATVSGNNTLASHPRMWMGSLPARCAVGKAARASLAAKPALISGGRARPGSQETDLTGNAHPSRQEERAASRPSACRALTLRARAEGACVFLAVIPGAVARVGGVRYDLFAWERRRWPWRWPPAAPLWRI